MGRDWYSIRCLRHRKYIYIMYPLLNPKKLCSQLLKNGHLFLSFLTLLGQDFFFAKIENVLTAFFNFLHFLFNFVTGAVTCSNKSNEKMSDQCENVTIWTFFRQIRGWPSVRTKSILLGGNRKNVQMTIKMMRFGHFQNKFVTENDEPKSILRGFFNLSGRYYRNVV